MSNIIDMIEREKYIKWIYMN